MVDFFEEPSSLRVILHYPNAVHIRENLCAEHDSESLPQELDEWVRKEIYSLHRVIVEEDGEIASPHVICVAHALEQPSTLNFHFSVIDQPMRIQHDQAGQFCVSLCKKLHRKVKCLLNDRGPLGKLRFFDSFKGGFGQRALFQETSEHPDQWLPHGVFLEFLL